MSSIKGLDMSNRDKLIEQMHTNFALNMEPIFSDQVEVDLSEIITTEEVEMIAEASETVEVIEDTEAGEEEVESEHVAAVFAERLGRVVDIVATLREALSADYEEHIILPLDMAILDYYSSEGLTDADIANATTALDYVAEEVASEPAPVQKQIEELITEIKDILNKPEGPTTNEEDLQETVPEQEDENEEDSTNTDDGKVDVVPEPEIEEEVDDKEGTDRDTQEEEDTQEPATPQIPPVVITPPETQPDAEVQTEQPETPDVNEDAPGSDDDDGEGNESEQIQEPQGDQEDGQASETPEDSDEAEEDIEDSKVKVDNPNKDKNNGHGNGDQDAPGNSGDNNNAENAVPEDVLIEESPEIDFSSLPEEKETGQDKEKSNNGKPDTHSGKDSVVEHGNDGDFHGVNLEVVQIVHDM